MKTVNIGPWTYYINGLPTLNEHKTGKWMYFFGDKDRVKKLCKNAVNSGVVSEAKHSNAPSGVACFYLEYDDIATHKKVINFFLQNDMIQRTKSGKLYNISFKLDDQTRVGEYGDKFHGKITLSNFLNLNTGEWL